MSGVVELLYDDVFTQHDTGDHPESAERLVWVLDALDEEGLLERLRLVTPHSATRSDLERAHTLRLIRQIRLLAEVGGGAIDYDTLVGRHSYRAAAAAAGATIDGARAVIGGAAEAAFALVRPPGHHAMRDQAMGFCLFNNVAVAALWALDEAGLDRVAIVDFDVHHGNGTDDILGGDPRALYISTHLYPFYPGTGHWRDVGTGAGVGTSINVPLPARTGDHGFLRVYRQVVIPAIERFAPELILVSAGYDGHWADPLAWMELSAACYGELVGLLSCVADAVCDGRLVFSLEGGYHPQALPACVAATLGVLMGESYVDQLGTSGHAEADVQPAIDRTRRQHGL